jgi:hypothetical protein
MLYLLFSIILTAIIIRKYLDFQEKRSNKNSDLASSDFLTKDNEVSEELLEALRSKLFKILIICTYDSKKFKIIESDYDYSYCSRALSEDIEHLWHQKYIDLMYMRGMLSEMQKKMLDDLKLKFDLISHEEWMWELIDYDNDVRWKNINVCANEVLNEFHIQSRNFSFENNSPI